MSLTMGAGPLAGEPGGAFNFDLGAAPAHRIFFEVYPRRLRAIVGGRTILDTIGARLLHETNSLPVAYVPFDALDPSLLERTERSTHCPFKGDATYWSLRLSGEDIRENVVWGYEQPVEGAEWLEGYVALYWDRMDEIFVEYERQLGHLRDPYHRVDAIASSRKVRVTAHGEVVAETNRPVMVFETGIPPRAYLPRADVRARVLAETATRSMCPYKGEATYWSVGGIDDVAWSYESPLPEALPARGHVSFAGEGIEVEIA